VPFAALRTPSGASLLDLQPDQSNNRIALAQAPSATILIRNCLNSLPSQATQVLAIGFNDPNGSQPLRFAEAEAAHVANLFAGQLLNGPQAKREHIHQQLNQLRYLHIAGHARFTPDDPLGSWLLLGEDDRLTARQIIDTIALAADLVTLSSCTSGISHVVPGDELLGLPRALLYAGTPTVICTRWEAIDIVTLLLMDRFYQELRQCSPGIALRNAQVAIRDMTHDQLRDILTTWHNQGGILAEALGDPQELLQDLGATPFSAPMLWAPFMLIGRA
jgi:CHAT domain-containing protein